MTGKSICLVEEDSCVFSLLLQGVAEPAAPCEAHDRSVASTSVVAWAWLAWKTATELHVPIYGRSPSECLLLWMNTVIFLITHRRSWLIRSSIWFRCFNSKTNGKNEICSNWLLQLADAYQSNFFTGKKKAKQTRIPYKWNVWNAWSTFYLHLVYL